MAVVVTLNIMLRGQSVCNCCVRLFGFFVLNMTTGH